MKKYILLLVFLNIQSVFGQSPVINQYTIHDGLVQMQVMKLFKDSRGILWVLTKNGISKFNGQEFENFTTLNGQLSSNFYGVDEDSKGNMWFLGNKGVTKYNGKEFKHYPVSNPRSKLIITNDDEILLVNCSKGIYKILEGDSFEETDMFISIFTEKVNALKYRKIEGDFLISVNNNLHKLKNGETELLHEFDFPFLISTHPDGTIFIREMKNGVEYIYKVKNNTIELPFVFDINSKTHSNSSDNIFYKKLRYESIIYFTSKNNKIDSIVLPDINIINEMLIDEYDNMWIATEEGLLRYYNNGFNCFSKKQLPYIWGVVEGNNDDMFFSSFGNGLKRITESNVIEDVNINHPGREEIIQQYYFSPCKTEDGNIFLPYSGGLIQIESSKTNDEYIYSDMGLKSTCLMSMYDKDLKNTFAALKGKVAVIDSNSNVNYIENEEGQHGLNYVIGMKIDSYGDLWMSSFSGLSKYNYKTDKVEYYLPENQRLPNDGVISIEMDNNETVWFGGMNGLLFYDRKMDSIIKIGESLFNEAISDLTIINDDILMISSSSGIYLFDLEKWYVKKEVCFYLLNQYNGYPGMDPGQNSAYVDSKERVWIPSATDVCMIEIDNLKFDINDNKVFIRELNGTKIPWNNRSKTLVDKGQKDIKFKFETVGYSRPFKSRYSYQLLPNRKEFSDWSDQDCIFLNDLPSGDYKLVVRSRSNVLSDNTSYSQDVLEFEIKYPFYEDLSFFKSLFIPFIALLLLLGFNYSTSRQLKAKLKYNELNERFLQTQTLQSQMNPHFIFNALTTVQDAILSKDIKHANKVLVSLSELIRRFLNSNINANSPDESIEESTVPLSEEIALLNKYVEFEQLQYEGKINYQLHVEPIIDVEKVRIPPLIVQPFVENAIKHGILNMDTKGSLCISFQYDPIYFICKVEDNGVGIRKSKELQKLSIKKFKSIGKKLVKKRISILNEMDRDIQIYTDDRPNKGTIVTIKFNRIKWKI